VLKEEGQFREFNGTLDYDPTRPQQARIDVVAQAASLDTKPRAIRLSNSTAAASRETS